MIDALEQEVELRRERKAPHVFVEALQERVFLRRFQQRVGTQVLRKRARQQRMQFGFVIGRVRQVLDQFTDALVLQVMKVLGIGLGFPKAHGEHLVDIVVTRGLTFVPLYVLGFAQAAVFAYVLFVSFQAVLIHANVSWRFGPLRWLLEAMG